MQVRIQRMNVAISEPLQAELQRSLMASLGRYVESIERITLRLGESKDSSRRSYGHCRATAQLRGGKTVWVDRSHPQLASAALNALEQLGNVVDEALRRSTGEFPALDEDRSMMGSGWVMLGPL